MTQERRFHHVSVDPDVVGQLPEEAKTALSATSPAALNLTDERPNVPHFRQGKSVLHLSGKRGKVFGTCATMNESYACCNFKVLKAVSNCPFDCTYCFLQNYLTNGTTSVVVDVDAMMDEVRAAISAEPKRFFRIGTWELGDSLALEDVSQQARQLAEAFTELDQAVLELKTKSANVDSLLDCDHNNKTVVSWSINTPEMINRFEHRTASFDDRLAAMAKVVDAGYPVGLHFDPMILYEAWREDYVALVQALFAVIPAEQIAWVSIGSLRYNPEQKKKMEVNFPKSILSNQEMVLGDDNKVRYVKPVRREMYDVLVSALRRYAGADVFIYLCMERWDMWQDVLGFSPTSIGDLDYMFAAHLYDRFEGMVPCRPIRSDYETMIV